MFRVGSSLHCLQTASVIAMNAITDRATLGAAPAFEECSVVELRDDIAPRGQRDMLIDLFERELIEPQEACGMRLLAQIRDLDHHWSPNTMLRVSNFAAAGVPLPRSVLRRVMQVLRARLRRAISRWQRRQVAYGAYRTLCELDDRTLCDLGLHRSEIWPAMIHSDPTRMARGCAGGYEFDEAFCAAMKTQARTADAGQGRRRGM
jgi:uncharacterized protein YjiS (DUF1127 family)